MTKFTPSRTRCDAKQSCESQCWFPCEHWGISKVLTMAQNFQRNMLLNLGNFHTINDLRLCKWVIWTRCLIKLGNLFTMICKLWLFGCFGSNDCMKGVVFSQNSHPTAKTCWQFVRFLELKYQHIMEYVESLEIFNYPECVVFMVLWWVGQVN